MTLPVYSLILVIIVGVSQVQSKVKIFYVVGGYTNPENKDERGYPCDRFLIVRGYCDPEFTLTATAYTHDWNQIDTVNSATRSYSGTSYLQHVLSTDQVYSRLPAVIKIELHIFDVDLFGREQMAHFKEMVIIQNVGVYALNFGSQFQVKVTIDIRCLDDLYGAKCNVRCKRNPGRWTCDKVTGDRVCADEYYGEKCDVHCKPRAGRWTCDKVTGGRVCADEYYGEKCDVHCSPSSGQWWCNNITGARERIFPLTVDTCCSTLETTLGTLSVTPQYLVTNEQYLEYSTSDLDLPNQTFAGGVYNATGKPRKHQLIHVFVAIPVASFFLLFGIIGVVCYHRRHRQDTALKCSPTDHPSSISLSTLNSKRHCSQYMAC